MKSMDDRRDMKILRLAGARKTSEDTEKREGEWTTGQVFLAGRAVKDPSQEGG